MYESQNRAHRLEWWMSQVDFTMGDDARSVVLNAMWVRAQAVNLSDPFDSDEESRWLRTMTEGNASVAR